MDAGQVAALDPGSSSAAGQARPNLTYVGLIREAIVESPEQRLYLREIYEAIAEKYPYYRDQQSSTWKNVIRHCLSITPAFKNLPKESHQPGKGGLWSIDDSIPDAYSRRRVRKSDHAKPSTSSSGSNSTKSRRRSTASEGSSTAAPSKAPSSSVPASASPPKSKLDQPDASWSLDPPGMVSSGGGSGSSTSLQDPTRSTWMSPSSTYSTQPGNGSGLFEQSPSAMSDGSAALAPSPFSMPHSMPQPSPAADGSFAIPTGQYSTAGPSQSYAPPYAQPYGMGMGGHPAGPMSYAAPHRSTHHAYSAPITPSSYSPTLPTASATSSSAPYGQLQYPLSLQVQMVDALSHQQQQQPSYLDTQTYQGTGPPSASLPLLQMHLGGHAPTRQDETTSLGLSISHLQWRQLPAVAEQPSAPTSSYSWPPVSLQPGLHHGRQSGLDPAPADSGGLNEAIAPPERKKGTQTSEWDAGLRY